MFSHCCTNFGHLNIKSILMINHFGKFRSQMTPWKKMYFNLRPEMNVWMSYMYLASKRKSEHGLRNTWSFIGEFRLCLTQLIKWCTCTNSRTSIIMINNRPWKFGHINRVAIFYPKQLFFSTHLECTLNSLKRNLNST